MNFDKCKECGKITIAPRRWGETVICESCYQENLRKTEHEKEEKIRADEREEIRDKFKIYNRLEAKFTLSQCSEKDGLYCLDVTELFYGFVDRVLKEQV